MGLVEKNKELIIKVLPLTKKRKEEIDKEIKHTYIDADGDITKWIKLSFPKLNKEEIYRVEALNQEYLTILFQSGAFNVDDSEEEDAEE